MKALAVPTQIISEHEQTAFLAISFLVYLRLLCSVDFASAEEAYEYICRTAAINCNPLLGATRLFIFSVLCLLTISNNFCLCDAMLCL